VNATFTPFKSVKVAFTAHGVGVAATPLLVGGVAVVAGAEVDGCWVVVLGVCVGVSDDVVGGVEVSVGVVLVSVGDTWVSSVLGAGVVAGVLSW